MRFTEIMAYSCSPLIIWWGYKKEIYAAAQNRKNKAKRNVTPRARNILLSQLVPPLSPWYSCYVKTKRIHRLKEVSLPGFLKNISDSGFSNINPRLIKKPRTGMQILSKWITSFASFCLKVVYCVKYQLIVVFLCTCYV